jgi:cytochrome c-type biogenesis protein CcmH/NrfF
MGRLRGRSTRRAGAAALIVALLAVTSASARSLDDRVYAVASRLMCPVCAGQTVAESDSTVAREMRAIIRQKLASGETPDQILRYFVGQFGEGVLAEPPRHGVSLLLYVGPLLALAVGLALAVYSIARWARRTGTSDGATAADEPNTPAEGAAPPDPRDLDRIARQLAARGR